MVVMAHNNTDKSHTPATKNQLTTDELKEEQRHLNSLVLFLRNRKPYSGTFPLILSIRSWASRRFLVLVLRVGDPRRLARLSAPPITILPSPPNEFRPMPTTLCLLLAPPPTHPHARTHAQWEEKPPSSSQHWKWMLNERGGRQMDLGLLSFLSLPPLQSLFLGVLRLNDNIIFMNPNTLLTTSPSILCWSWDRGTDERPNFPSLAQHTFRCQDRRRRP